MTPCHCADEAIGGPLACLGCEKNMAMPKHGASVDRNQKAIVWALKAVGCEVWIIRSR